MNVFDAWVERAEDFYHEGLRQSYTDTKGDGPVVLLLHGYPTWSYDWADIILDLSQKARVVALDWIGYGLSDKPRHHVSVAMQIDRLEVLLDAIQVDRFHLVAHDYGATCAQEILDRDRLSTRIESLTLMNGGVVFNAYRPTRTQKMMLTPFGPLITRFLSRKTLQEKMDAVRGRPLPVPQFDVLWQGMSQDKGVQKAHIRQRYILERAEHWPRWEEATKRWTGPTQLIWGPEDPISGQHVLDPLKDMLPHARVISLEGVGHFVPDEAPDQVARALTEFIHG